MTWPELQPVGAALGKPAQRLEQQLGARAHASLRTRNFLEEVGPPDITDEEMPYLFYNAVEPPNVARPSGTWTELDAALDQLRSSASALGAWADSATVDLRSHGLVHPVFGMLDGAQWLRFSAVHTWRHRSELRAVRRSIDA